MGAKQRNVLVAVLVGITLAAVVVGAFVWWKTAYPPAKVKRIPKKWIFRGLRDLTYAPDGKHIYYIKDFQTDPTVEDWDHSAEFGWSILFRSQVDGDSAEWLYDREAFDWALSPSGKSVAASFFPSLFPRKGEPHCKIQVLDVAGGRIVGQTETDLSVHHLGWNPDGRSFWFSNRHGIFLLDPRGGRRQLAEGAFEPFGWSGNDEKLFLYSRYSELPPIYQAGSWEYPSRGSWPWRRGRPPVDRLFDFDAPTYKVKWLFDVPGELIDEALYDDEGNRIFYVLKDGEDAPRHLISYDLATGKRGHVLDKTGSLGTLHMSADGRRLIYYASEAGKATRRGLYSLDLRTGKERCILHWSGSGEWDYCPKTDRIVYWPEDWPKPREIPAE